MRALRLLLVVLSAAGAAAASCGVSGGVAHQSAAAAEPPPETAVATERLAQPSAPSTAAAAPAEGPRPTSEGEPSEPSEDANAVALGEEFSLKVGETAVFEDGLEVTFESVVGDSRCPRDVDCIWEGNAEIAVEVARAGEDPASLRLNTNPRFATEAAYLDYTIRLVELEPYPVLNPPADEPYRATLLVTAVAEE